MELLAGVVILYNPDSDVDVNIAKYVSYVSKLYIVDNTEDEQKLCKNRELLADILTKNNVVYLQNAENMGIAYSLNRVLKLVEGKYQWILTMDQDSTFVEDNMPRYLKRMNILKSCTGVISFAPKDNGYYTGVEIGDELESIWRCMTAGNIVNVEKAAAIGGWNEELFIDEVDNEFCYRAKTQGYDIYCCKDVILKHTVGDPRKCWFLWKYVIDYNHNYVRLYYIVRNQLYILKHYPQHRYTYLRSILKSVTKMIFFEKDRKRKCRSVYEGVKDFILGNYGKKKITY